MTPRDLTQASARGGRRRAVGGASLAELQAAAMSNDKRSTVAPLAQPPQWPTAPHPDDIYIQLTLGLEAVSASRPRVRGAEYTVIGQQRIKTRAAQGYNKKELGEYKETVGWLLRRAHVERNDVDDLGVHVIFHVRGMQKGDVDNLAKALLDGCNKIAWHDDRQVTRLTSEIVRNCDHPHIDLVIYVTERRARDCQNCGKPMTARQITDGRIFCSKGCYDRDQRLGINRKCVTCGTTVYRNSGKSRSKNVYCSPECRATGPGTCRECGKQSVEQWTNRRFCSTECSVKWHQRQALTPKSKPTGTCEDCGGPVFGTGSKRCRACHVAYVAPKGRGPIRTGATYDNCPDCGGRKRTISQRCVACFRGAAGRPASELTAISGLKAATA